MQLAAALGLNTQTMLEPIVSRSDFERIVELNRSQQIPLAPDSHVKPEIENLPRLGEHHQPDTNQPVQPELNDEAPILQKDNSASSQDRVNKISNMDVDYQGEPLGTKTSQQDVHYQSALVQYPQEHNRSSPCTQEIPKVTEKQDHINYNENSCEQNQNNQNLLNQQEQREPRPCGTDDMWRPW